MYIDLDQSVSAQAYLFVSNETNVPFVTTSIGSIEAGIEIVEYLSYFRENKIDVKTLSNGNDSLSKIFHLN